MKKKEFKVVVTPDDIIDVTLKIEKSVLLDFALNYRARIDSKWYEIYRVDTAHGYLHEQRYWISPKPIKLSEGELMNVVFDRYYELLKENFERFRGYYVKNMEEGGFD